MPLSIVRLVLVCEAMDFADKATEFTVVQPIQKVAIIIINCNLEK